ncbi:5'/3'-nucleotidase SurE [Halorubrum sp. SD626R]|uniref:5'/3'-nucleotidase SurE n=1 Tax=Halorubrum sp. SD626R TaxID=1419722 RepID=UPI000A59BF34|nr:5'/3'-nucleotidase SurE [Halorubrum sp. SD626R]TKX79454.1 5'/3'-nucleotidase SurE [Halorubrum sp. SD626R]
MTLEILLTNDDGIDAVGIRALSDALSREHDVTVVAPKRNQSGVGGARSWWETTVEYAETDAGYAVEGTPADCVAVAEVALGLDPDVVVSGCNHGPNIGAHILGQSGTVGAAMEAAFLGTPAIAASLYDRGNLPVPPTLAAEDFALAAEAVLDLLDRAEEPAGDASDGEGGDSVALPFDADVLNVNAPAADDEAASDPTYRITEPARGFDVIEFRPGEEGPDEENVPEGWEFGERRGEMGMELRDRFWREFLRGDVADDPGSDRLAAVEGEVSVSPLSSSRSVAGDCAGEVVAVGGEVPRRADGD